MRDGFTTGSCAAAAALASCIWQRDGACPAHVAITVPEGRVFTAEITAHAGYECGVIKDAGDDPDVTDGYEVRARVELSDSAGPVEFCAGEGVGVITLPGLKLPVGEAAINPVPRDMIARAVRSVFPEAAARVTVSIPGGAELAARTFNPRLGIVGGLSVLGTTGIVRPMSEEALTESIALELRMRRAQGLEELALVFGSQGEAALSSVYPGLRAAQISNFVGFALDTAAELGYRRLLLAGHPGKLSKVAAGVMQTHSHYADARREAIMAHLALIGAPVELVRSVHDSATTDAAMRAIADSGYDGVWRIMADSASAYCEARVRGACEVDVLFIDGSGTALGMSARMREDENRWKKS